MLAFYIKHARKTMRGNRHLCNFLSRDMKAK